MIATTPQLDSTIAKPPLAPRWHTALLIALMLIVATLGSIMAMRGALVTAPPPSSRIPYVYLPTFVVEWAMAIYVFRIGRPRSALPALIGLRWTTMRRALGDVGLAFLLFVFIDGSETVYAHFSDATASAAVLAILPRTTTEYLAWTVLAASVGFCEEVIYRGYLRIQIAVFSRSIAIGVVAQAILFGIAHGEQGWTTALRFTVYGAAFGVVAVRRRSLLPGIVCHIAIDLSSGFLHH
jgi:membrane protease YdiL (CAAX protease family)